MCIADSELNLLNIKSFFDCLPYNGKSGFSYFYFQFSVTKNQN